MTAARVAGTDPIQQQIDENLKWVFDLPAGELPSALRLALERLRDDRHTRISSGSIRTEEPVETRTASRRLTRNPQVVWFGSDQPLPSPIL